MTPQEVITEVRNLVQDTMTPYRYSDAFLLGFVNQIVKQIALVRPDLFTEIGDIPTVPDTVVQSCPSDSQRLVELFHVKGGGVIAEISRLVLDHSTPEWAAEASGTPVNYARHPRNPNQFFLYPRPAAGVVLVGEYVRSPPTYAIDEEVELLPDAYLPAVVNGTVWLVESVDNEHISSGRAKLFQDMFMQSLGINLQARPVTDDEAAGMDAKRVIQ